MGGAAPGADGSCGGGGPPAEAGGGGAIPGPGGPAADGGGMNDGVDITAVLLKSESEYLLVYARRVGGGVARQVQDPFALGRGDEPDTDDRKRDTTAAAAQCCQIF